MNAVLIFSRFGQGFLISYRFRKSVIQIKLINFKEMDGWIFFFFCGELRGIFMIFVILINEHNYKIPTFLFCSNLKAFHYDLNTRRFSYNFKRIRI